MSILLMKNFILLSLVYSSLVTSCLSLTFQWPNNLVRAEKNGFQKEPVGIREWLDPNCCTCRYIWETWDKQQRLIIRVLRISCGHPQIPGLFSRNKILDEACIWQKGRSLPYFFSHFFFSLFCTLTCFCLRSFSNLAFFVLSWFAWAQLT